MDEVLTLGKHPRPGRGSRRIRWSVVALIVPLTIVAVVAAHLTTHSRPTRTATRPTLTPPPRPPLLGAGAGFSLDAVKESKTVRYSFDVLSFDAGPVQVEYTDLDLPPGLEWIGPKVIGPMTLEP